VKPAKDGGKVVVSSQSFLASAEDPAGLKLSSLLIQILTQRVLFRPPILQVGAKTYRSEQKNYIIIAK
jgi:hypothetical protein